MGCTQRYSIFLELSRKWLPKSTPQCNSIVVVRHTLSILSFVTFCTLYDYFSLARPVNGLVRLIILVLPT